MFYLKRLGLIVFYYGVKRYFLVTMFLFFTVLVFGVSKYDVLVSDDNYVFLSALYKNEGIYTDFFYKFNSFLSLGVEFNSLFNVPIYGYSGYIEEVINVGDVGLYFNLFKLKLLGRSFGGMVKLSYEYILDYRKFLISFDVYSLGVIKDSLEYFAVLKNFSLGVYTTKYIPLRFLMDPLDFCFDFFYKIGSFKFLLGGMSSLDLEFFRFTPALGLGVMYFYDSFEFGLSNTFRVGNLLNLEVFFSLLMVNFYAKFKFGFGYVNGFSSGVEFFVKI